MLARVQALLPLETRAIWGWDISFDWEPVAATARRVEIGCFDLAFSIMDREDQEDLIAAVVANSEIDTKQIRFPTAEVLGDLFSFP